MSAGQKLCGCLWQWQLEYRLSAVTTDDSGSEDGSTLPATSPAQNTHHVEPMLV